MFVTEMGPFRESFVIWPGYTFPSTSTPPSARAFYAMTVKALMAGGKPAYTQKLQFELPRGDTGDPDRPAAMTAPRIVNVTSLRSVHPQRTNGASSLTVGRREKDKA